jgi:hypothetical protein
MLVKKGLEFLWVNPVKQARTPKFWAQHPKRFNTGKLLDIITGPYVIDDEPYFRLPSRRNPICRLRRLSIFLTFLQSTSTGTQLSLSS